MKIINSIFKILASLCMTTLLTLAWVTMLKILFDSNTEWMIVVPIWLRFLILIGSLSLSGFAVYLDYLRLNKSA